MKINEGTKIASITSDALTKIVENVKTVSEIITSISSASQSQSDAVSKVTSGIKQISDVVQKNSAEADKSAMTAQELSSQSYCLNETLSKFKI